MFYVYFLKSLNGDEYIGYTSNLRRRLAEHNEGKSKHTKGKQWQLVYYEAYKAEPDARTREQQLKYRGQAKAQLKRRTQASRQD